jgi:hypothetical protein
LADSGHNKWPHGPIDNRVRRSAAVDSGKAERGPAHVPVGVPRRVSLNVPVADSDLPLADSVPVADSAPEWRIDQIFGRPATCVPRRDRAWVIGRT